MSPCTSTARSSSCRSDTSCRAVQGVLDDRLGARMSKFLPLGGDEIDELARFVRSSRQAGTRRRPPHRGRCRHEYLQPLVEWMAQARRGTARGAPEAAHPDGDVTAQEADTAPAPDQSQHGDLVTTSGSVLRNQQFQHCGRAVDETGLGHEGLAGVREVAPHRDRPLDLELGDQAGRSRNHPSAPQAVAALATTSGTRSVISQGSHRRRRDPRASRPLLDRGCTTGTISLPHFAGTVRHRHDAISSPLGFAYLVNHRTQRVVV